MKILNTINFILNHRLNSDKKLKVLFKYIYWQFLSKIFKRNRVINYGTKTRLIIKDGYTSATGCYYCGLIEFEIMGFILHFLNENDLFIDVGANVGTFTLLASSEKNANSICFEPDLNAFNYLNENILLNNLNNVVTHNIGVSSKMETLKFTTTKGAMNHVAVNDQNEIINVKFDSIDNKCKIEKPTVIKIDVEGYEKEVILGMTNTLNNNYLKAVIIECNTQNEKYKYSFSEIEAILNNNGFEKYDYDPFKRQLIKLMTNDPLNLIFIRDYNFVKQRLINSAKVKFNDISF